MGKAAKHRQLLYRSMVQGNVNVLLPEMGTEQAGQWNCASLAVRLYAKKKAQIAEYITTLFREKGDAITALNDCQDLQLFLKTVQKSPSPVSRNQMDWRHSKLSFSAFL